MAKNSDVRLEFLVKDVDVDNPATIRDHVDKLMKSKEFADTLKEVSQRTKSEAIPVAAARKIDLEIKASSTVTANPSGGGTTTSGTISVGITIHF